MIVSKFSRINTGHLDTTDNRAPSGLEYEKESISKDAMSSWAGVYVGQTTHHP